MVRKTKFATEQTRQQIIAAARAVFAERGVSRTTLAQIASKAGVTRGAIYWHFANKPALFFAMMEQVSLPLIDRMDENLPASGSDDPLRGIRSQMREVLRLIETDPTARTTFEIINLKCEYVDEFASLDTQMIQSGCNFMAVLERAYKTANKQGLLRDGADAPLLALESFAFMKGLIRLWLSDSDGSVIRKKAGRLIDAHIALRYREKPRPVRKAKT
ncbi:MAG: TetR family transcriptional regulator [Sulfuricaulis sp.]